MIILGISDGAEPAAALLINGELVAAVTEAAIRRAPAIGFPSGAVDAALDIAGVRPRDVDRVVFAGSFTPAALFRARPGLRRRREIGEMARGMQAFLRRSGLYMLDQSGVTGILHDRMRGLGFGHAFTDTLDHDRAHATAAYRTQARDELLIFTFDTPGDGAAFTVSRSRHLQIDRLHLQTTMSGLCCLLSRVAAVAGVPEAELERLARGELADPHGAGAPGEPSGQADPAILDPEIRRALSGMLRYEGPGFSRQPIRRGPDPLLRWRGRGQALAAAALDVVGEALAACAADWVGRTGVKHVAATGELVRLPGLAGRIASAPGVETLWVPPMAGDEGLAIGAALGAAGTGPLQLRDPCLGPDLDAKAAYRALSNASLPREEQADPEATAATWLAEGLVIARCAGRLEFAAQGLGNRDFLAADPAALRAALSSPKEPSPEIVLAVRAEEAGRYLPTLAQAADAARFATVRMPASAAVPPGFADAAGWVLPQVVHAADDPTFHAILTRRAAAGAPYLASARLARAGEPIANTAADAVGAWRESRAGGLLLGPYAVRR